MDDQQTAPEVTPSRPLTEWKNEPGVRELKQDLMDAKPSHDTQVRKIDEWLDNLNVTGKAQVKPPEGQSRVTPKLIRKQAEWRYAALSEPFLSTEDVFDVSPVSWEDSKSAQQNQLVLNNQFNTKLNKVPFIDEYVRTAVDEGTVIVRVGWDFEEEEYEETVPDVQYKVDPEAVPMHEQLTTFKEQYPERFEQEVSPEMQRAHALTMEHGRPITASITGHKTVTKTRTIKNQPSLEICDYRNLIIDPSCRGHLDKARFIIYSFESSKSELKKDGRYTNLDQINTNTNSILAEPDHAANDASDFNFSDEPRKKFAVYEYWGYWDIDGSGLVKPFVAAWVGDTLIRMEENPFPDKKLPFVSVQYLPVRKETHGEPDGALLEDNQKILGAVTRGMIDLLGKSANGQTGMRKDMLDATNRRKFERGQDYEFNAGVDPRQGVYTHVYPDIPQGAQVMLQMQNAEAESLTGVKAFNNGISSESLGDVAAGIRGALDAASKRELGILRRLADGMVQIGRKIIAMNAVFLDEEEVVRVTNEEFVKVRRDDLPGNLDLKLSISTAEEDNQKAQELSFMLQTMGNNMDPSMSRMILADIARLRKMPELAKRIEEYEPQPDPMQQKKLQLEIEELQANVAKIQSETIENRAGAQLDAAKAGTEQAKSGHLESETDLKNLSFVEQESGVSQERELEKHRAQSDAQMRQKLADHQLRRSEKQQGA